MEPARLIASLAVPRTAAGRLRRLGWKGGLAAVVLFLLGWWTLRWLLVPAGPGGEITVAAARADLPITVSERGELESSKTVDVRCEVEGHQNKLISIVPEGSRVTKGQEVARFDADQLSRQVLEQEVKFKTAQGRADAAKGELEVQKQKAASDIAKAELGLIKARLDRELFIPTDPNQQGEFQMDVDEKKGDIELARKDLEDAKEKLGHYRTFVKKGFGTPEQLRVKELEVERQNYTLSSKIAKLKVFMSVARERKLAELDFNAGDSIRELERAKKSGEAAVKKAQSDYDAAMAAAQSEKQALDRLRSQLERCVIRAPAGGILVYSKEYYWDTNSRVQPGAMVHYLQTIFSLPDLTKMQVKVRIHEAMIKKVKVGQQAEIQVDAYPNAMLHGTVQSVGTLADSRGGWDERGVKEYVTVVTIRDLPLEAGLKPGMTAQVKILANEIPNVLVVPVQAVTEREGKHYCYLAAGRAGIMPREVTVGENNEKYVEIKDGLAEGERVTLDARARSTAEAKAREQQEAPAGPKPAATAKQPAPAPTPPSAKPAP